MKRENKFSRALWIVLVVMTVLVLLSAVASVVMYFVSETNKGLETTVNQILMSVPALLCFGIPIFFKRKLKVYIPPLFLIVIYLFIYAHFILGEIFRVYDKSMIFDKILHAADCGGAGGGTCGGGRARARFRGGTFGRATEAAEE